jgi:hypothetical protein
LATGNSSAPAVGMKYRSMSYGNSRFAPNASRSISSSEIDVPSCARDFTRNRGWLPARRTAIDSSRGDSGHRLKPRSLKSRCRPSAVPWSCSLAFDPPEELCILPRDVKPRPSAVDIFPASLLTDDERRLKSPGFSAPERPCRRFGRQVSRGRKVSRAPSVRAPSGLPPPRARGATSVCQGGSR